MPIIDIKNSTLRRLVLVATIVPLVVVGLIWGGFMGSITYATSIIDAIKPAWRGR